MGSFMSADVATPPTSGWLALASGLTSDSATLISRLIILLIFINIGGLGLHSAYGNRHQSPRLLLDHQEFHQQARAMVCYYMQN
jgi:hypothetical protein